MKKEPKENKSGIKTAILVDGGFYRKRAFACLGDKTPKERADELESYCKRHLKESMFGENYTHDLYRIFYYDCEPLSKNVFNPLTSSNIDLSKTDTFSWTKDFFEELRKRRKFALRLGKLSDSSLEYYLRPSALKKLCRGDMLPSDIEQKDIYLNVEQKGVDMKIGIDIASLAYKNQVNQIVLIAGDSDFVPASKLARREGIDFILDPLGAVIKTDLFEHIDGLNTKDEAYKLAYSKSKQKSKRHP